jgi:hypothetical protein
VFAAVPRLQVLKAGVMSLQCAALIPLLRNDPPYGPLRVSNLYVIFDQAVVADVLAFTAAVASHESLKGLTLLEMRFARELNALVDVAAERRFAWFSTRSGCLLDAESVPALTRLLKSGSLTRFEVDCAGFQHAHETSVLELCAAVRTCPTLNHLRLQLDLPDGASRRVVAELLDAVVSLPSLSVLDLTMSRMQDATALGQALGAFLGANLPTLRSVRVRDCRLGDEGMAALLDGLAANTHLRKLKCGSNDLSEAFKRDRLAPALAVLAARAALDA